MAETDIFARNERLFGSMDRLRDARVIIFGVGGVGSWCAESLVRSGVGHLTILDQDRVVASNINRQLMATTKTVGRVKVEVLRERLLEINPDADIVAIEGAYNKTTADSYDLSPYDYIIDAIDSLSCKTELLLRASRTRATVFSSMGAALKVDPTRVRVAEFWDVRGCPLGAAIRKKMRQNKTLPAKKFLCVYDDEVLPNVGEGESNGTTAHITGIFGLTLAGLVIKDIYSKG
ncbi:MAG: ThiF family adenylyltransferase [Candidatus Cryptobacteroides sp.]